MEEKNKWFHFIHEYLVDQGLSEINASYLNTFLLFVLLIALIALVDYVLWKVIRSATTRLARKTKTNFDNLMVANRLPRHLAHIFPLLLALELLPLVFYDFDYAGSIAMKVLYIIWVVVILRIIRSFLHTLKDYLKTLPRFKDKPWIKSSCSCISELQNSWLRCSGNHYMSRTHVSKGETTFEYVISVRTSLVCVQN